MKTFTTHLKESRMTTHAEIVAAIAVHKKAPEVLNPVYKDLVDQAKRVMSGGRWDTKPNGLLDLVRNEQSDRDPDLNDLYYTSFEGFTSHNKIQKLVDKLAKKNKPHYKSMIDSVRKYLADWKPVGEDLKAMKSKVVKVTTKRAEAKQAAEKVLGKQFSDSSSLIKIFESHLAEYKKTADQRAREFVKERLVYLKKHGMDLNKAAPTGLNYNNYKRDQARRQSLSSITDPVGVDSSRGENIRKASRVKIERFVHMNVQGAEDAYRSFMAKMIQKIGKPVIDAKMTGNIWTNATLDVTTNDGESQVWNTKMILNFSKYQKMFNQFPSRRKK